MARDLGQPLVVMRCDASARIGFGHVTRSLALADAYRDTKRWKVLFAMDNDRDGVAVVERRGYQAVVPEAPLSSGGQGPWLEQVAASRHAHTVVLDVRADLDRASVRAIRERGVTVMTIDDGSDRRLEADLAFYPPVPQLDRLDWSGFQGRVYSGWDWIALRPEITAARERRARGGRGDSSVVIVSMGGSDPAGLTLRALAALDSLGGEFTTIVLLGGAFGHHEPLRRFISTARRQYEIRVDAPDFVDLAASADLAVASFGVTAYELAALGVPALHLCLTDDHAQSAGALAAAGASRNLGLHTSITDAALAREIAALLEDPAARRSMEKNALATLDGRGAERIVAVAEQHARAIHVSPTGIEQ